MALANKPIFSELIRSILIAAAVGAFLSCLALLSAYNYYADLLGNFRVQYIALLAVPFLLSILTRQWIVCTLTATALFIHTSSVLPLLIPDSRNSSIATNSLTVMSSNLQIANTSVQRYINFVRSVDPDIVVFQEYTEQWHAALEKQLNEYPFKITKEQSNPFGIGLYSKFELSDPEILYFERAGNPSIKVDLTRNGNEISIVGTHPVPPMTKNLFESRNAHLDALSRFARNTNKPTIVLGDLNVSSWSPWFKSILKNGNLRDARKGHAIHPSWPTFFYPAQIPIDHILVADTIHAADFQSSGNIGSDHRSVWAVLQY